jgi:hypothetical protein
MKEVMKKNAMKKGFSNALWLAGTPFLVCACPASAQQDAVSVGGVKWRVVDQGLADRGPLSTSQRAMPVDLRVGTNFDKVYELEGQPKLFGGGSDTTDYYMRMNGALTAVFPRSSYTRAGNGLERVDIPAGTVFSIGGPLRELVPGQPAQPAKGDGAKKVPSNREDLSAPPSNNVPPPAESARAQKQPSKPVNNASPPGPAMNPDAKDPNAPGTQPGTQPGAKLASPAAKEYPVGKSIWTDEEYRKQRLAALLDEAIKAKK